MRRAWILIGLGLLAATVAAADVILYPGAKLYSDRLVESPLPKRLQSGAWNPVSQERIYTTPASFRQVYLFYKQRYQETDENLKQTDKDIGNGRTMSTAYFCLDGAGSIAASGLWLRVQRPLLRGYRRAGMFRQAAEIKDLTTITIVRKWRARSGPESERGR